MNLQERERGDGRMRMVYHAPFPVGPGATSASGIRPWKMLEAFKALGFDVFEVTGYARRRRRRFAELRRQIDSGWRPAFVYSETATIPSSFTEPKHFPLVPELERSFFRHLHRHRVPIGVFYRDVYWSFPEYDERVGKTVASAMRVLYRREIRTFNRYVDVLFLPTSRMGEFIPGLHGPRLVALPPGADSHLKRARDSRKLELIYVGSLGGHHYDVSELVRGVGLVEDVVLTICAPREQVEKEKDALSGPGEKMIRLVSESGAGLERLYGQSQVGSLLMAPQQYRSFAAPMKLYEYLGHGKPVLVSEGTHAAEVVNRYDAGWVVPFNADSVAQVLARLRDNPEEVEEKSRNAQRAALENTWERRAVTVVDTLLPLRTTRTGPPHVLVVPSWYPEDAEDIHGSFFREQAEAIAGAGSRVGVLALSQRPIYEPRNAATTALRIGDEGPLGVVRADIRTYLPMQRWLNTKLSNRALSQAWDAYVERYGKPDVIHAHSLYPGAFYARALSERYGVPYVYTEHRTLSHMPARTVLAQWTERRVASGARSRHAVSKGHARHLEKRFGAGRWVYTPNLLPTLQPRSRERRETDTSPHFTFGHLSNLDPVKRVDLLLEAFAELHREDPSVRLVVGGDGEERERLLMLSGDLGISDVVRFTGNVPRDGVMDFYAGIDAFVLPSVTEPMGVVQIEALASGVPVVATRTWGGETVIEDPRDGLLVDIDNKGQLVEAMRVIRDRADGDADRAGRIQRCIERFGREAFVERYCQIYSGAVEAESGA